MENNINNNKKLKEHCIKQMGSQNKYIRDEHRTTYMLLLKYDKLLDIIKWVTDEILDIETSKQLGIKLNEVSEEYNSFNFKKLTPKLSELIKVEKGIDIKSII